MKKFRKQMILNSTPENRIEQILSLQSVQRALLNDFEISNLSLNFIFSDNFAEKYKKFSEDKKKRFCKLVGGIGCFKYVYKKLQEKGDK